jgi:hypothetical protein
MKWIGFGNGTLRSANKSDRRVEMLCRRLWAFPLLGFKRKVWFLRVHKTILNMDYRIVWFTSSDRMFQWIFLSGIASSEQNYLCFIFETICPCQLQE